MQFPPSFLDEIRNRLRPSEVISQRVRLKNSGRGEYTGLCPFHNEKTPSFTVSDDKGFYHCFGCSAHGDVIKFVMETGGLSFPEAVTMLAGEAGLQMPKEDPKAEEYYRRINTLYDVTETACLWFEEQLRLSVGKEALSYLRERGIDDNLIKTFRLGYAPDGKKALKEALLAKGCTEKLLIQAGLLIEVDGKEPYDRFRNRVIFPICDSKGRVIAFGGRILSEGNPKYLNSPETEIFHKGKVLYGLHLARQRAHDKGNIAAVEGYMDVIALHKAGITNAVAPLGTAVTTDHLFALWKLAKEPVICLDGDSAGKRAMYRVAELSLPLLSPGHSLRFAILPAGQDPDDVLKNHGPEFLRKILSSATPLSDVLWEVTLNQKPISTPEQKADFEQRVMELVALIKDQKVRDYYYNHFRERLQEIKVWYGKKNARQKNQQETGGKNPALRLAAFANISPREKFENLLVKVILTHPEMLSDPAIEEEFTRLDIQNRDLNRLYNAIIELSSQEEQELFAEKLCIHLEKLGFSDYIRKLEADISLDNFAKSGSLLSLAAAGWSYALAQYNLCLMEEEYKKAASQIKKENEEDYKKVFELKKQKDMLKKLAEKAEMSYEAALGD